MSSCPSRRDLEQFLKGEQPAADEPRLLAHLDACPACQEVMEELTAGGPAPQAPGEVHDPNHWDLVAALVYAAGSEHHASPAAITGILKGAASDAPAVSPDGLSLPPQVGPYAILRELGRGGMGVVYLAKQAALDRPVALKVLRFAAHASAPEVSRFRQEAQAIARLQHPNIVQVHEIGEHDGQRYLTLEYVAGGSLQERLRAAPQEPRAAAQMLETLARAVHYAHDHGIVHRDLKPANVLLTADGIPKVADFGLAKCLGTGLAVTQTGDVLGTPSYMAPEQARGHGHDITPRTDVYALGAILYEILTGWAPFLGSSALDTLEQVLTQEPVPPCRRRQNVPRDLETICLKCLHKEPRKRYASALELAEDLRRFTAGEPIRARPVSSWEKVVKWARRRPAVASLTAALVLLSITALGVIAGLWLRAEDRAVQAKLAEGAADERRRRAEETEARLALLQGPAFCEQGDVSRGLLWLARGLDRATQAGADTLERPLRINLADWSRLLSWPGIQLHNPGAILGLNFEPASGLLAVAGKDGCVHFWHLQEGREVGPPLRHPTHPPWPFPETWVSTVAFLPGGRAISAGAQGAEVWDLASRRPVGMHLPHTQGSMLWGLAVLPDGKRVVAIGDDSSIHVWDLASGKVVGAPLYHSYEGGFVTQALSPDGTLLVTGGRDHRAVRWNLSERKPIEPPLQHDARVSAVAFSRDGRRIITGTDNGALAAWDAKTGKGMNLPAQGSHISAIVFTPGGRLFATATEEGLVRLWDAGSLQPYGPAYRHDRAVFALTFSADGRTLVMALDDGLILTTEIPQSRATGAPLPVPEPARAVAFGPATAEAGPRLMIATRLGAQLWDPDSGQPVTSVLVNADSYDVNTAVLSPDGRTLAMGRWAGESGHWRGHAEVWDVATGQRRQQSPEMPEPAHFVAYSPDGRTVFVWSKSGEQGGALLWNVATEEKPRSLLSSLPTRVHRAAFLPDGRALVLACEDGRVRVWDVALDREIDPDRPLMHAGAVRAVTVAPDGRLLSGCRDGTAMLWDVAARRPLLEPLRHEAGVSAVAFSPDGKTLLTGDLAGGVRFWDAASGMQLGPTLHHTGAIAAVAFHPDGRRIAAGGTGSVVQQWLVPAPPLEGDPEQIRLRVEAATGMRLDEHGAVHALSAAEIEERRR
jgi:WD40 repeat protein/predicted Ser/Thr protein kinase